MIGKSSSVQVLTQVVEDGDPRRRIPLLVPYEVSLNTLFGNFFLNIDFTNCLERKPGTYLQACSLAVFHMRVFADTRTQRDGGFVKSSVKVGREHFALALSVIPKLALLVTKSAAERQILALKEKGRGGGGFLHDCGFVQP